MSVSLVVVSRDGVRFSVWLVHEQRPFFTEQRLDESLLLFLHRGYSVNGLFTGCRLWVQGTFKFSILLHFHYLYIIFASASSLHPDLSATLDNSD